MNFDPKAADCMWYFLHAISFNYNPSLHNPKDFIKFINLVGKTMPYPEIKPIFNKLLKKYIFWIVVHLIKTIQIYTTRKKKVFFYPRTREVDNETDLHNEENIKI